MRRRTRKLCAICWRSFEAPLAVQSPVPLSGFFPFNKFSFGAYPDESGPRGAYAESGGDDVKKRLMIVAALPCQAARHRPHARRAQCAGHRDQPRHSPGPRAGTSGASPSAQSKARALYYWRSTARPVPAGRRSKISWRICARTWGIQHPAHRAGRLIFDRRSSALQAGALIVKGRAPDVETARLAITT